MKQILLFLLCFTLLLSALPAVATANTNTSETEKFLYVSDLEWVSWKMFGSTSSDAAPPYRPSRDSDEYGNPLIIAGVTYEKGLRTHPATDGPAEFVYDISNYAFTGFSAIVGKDANGGAGAVAFRVLVDGKTVAESPAVPFGNSYELSCSFSGGSTLTLQVTDGGDGFGGDSAGFGDAKLYYTGESIEKPPVEIPEDDNMAPLEKYRSYLQDLSTLPVSFSYEGISYTGLGGDDFIETGRKTEQSDKAQRTIVTVKHLPSGVDITLDAVEYPAYNAYEWTVYFTNNTNENTGLFSDILGADTLFYGDNPVISGINGDSGAHYSEYAFPLTGKRTFSSTTGRPSHGTFPYYNLKRDNGGTFIAIGWPGTYKADFQYVQGETENATFFKAGQNNFSSYLKPGETVRTPLVAFVHYGETEDAVNAWRHWFIDCNMRTIDEEPFQPILTASTSWIYACMTSATESNQIDAIRKYREYGIDLDYWWMDAGWYLGANHQTISALDQSGNWKVDPNRFPTLFKAISEYAAQYDMGTILWFEPELFRLSLEQIMATNPDFKAEWVVGNLANNGKLNDFGNEEFRQWMFDIVTDIMETGGISVYRQDFNENPAPAWTEKDAQEENRTGVTENKYCQGYLAYWDMLIEDDPSRMIDNCASGGGRLDLESMRRSVILHRSDLGVSSDLNISQSMSGSLAKWLVYFGSSTNDSIHDSVDKYQLRSLFCPSMTLNFNVNNSSLNWPLLQALTQEWDLINDYYYADYYELLPWNCSSSQWRSWEYFDPDTGKGFVQVFRPEGATESTVPLQLKGLNPDATYVLTDFDCTNSITATGAQLAAGYTVTLEKARSAATVFIGDSAIEVPDYKALEQYNGVSEELDLTIPEDAFVLSDIQADSWIMFGGSSSDANPPYRPSYNSNEAGGVLTIGGVEFRKGIRTHVSERTLYGDMVYDISQYNYTTFRSIVGKDSAGTSGLIQFQVLVDGEVVAETPIMTAGEKCMIIADITGGKTLTLRAKDGGDLFTNDSVGWGNPILYTSAPQPYETVMQQIASLPETITISDETAIQKARTAYEALTDDQKALVANLDKLEQAEADLTSAKKAEADKAAAQAVVEQINALTGEDAKAIAAARAAYNALTDRQKALVTNLDKLEALEDSLAVETPAYGDVNSDEAIDAKDALLILQAAVDKIELTEEQTVKADVNGDKDIDAKDALLVLQKAVDKIEKFPVENQQ